MTKTFKILAIAIALFASVLSFAQDISDESTLNLDNVDIRVLINTVSEATGKNFIVDPRVKAKVTVVSSKPMSSNELYEIFLSILQVHGYSAVPGVNFIKIVPDTNAKQGPIPTSSNSLGGPRDELVTRVIQINNAPANQLVPILRPLVPQQGHLAAYVPTNVIVVTDRAANIDRLVRVISRMDKSDNKEIDIVALENSSADDIVRLLSQLEQKSSGKNKTASSQKVIADERSNSVLISGDKATRVRLTKLVKKLDQPVESTGNTKVVFLRYADAKKMAEILTGVAKKSASKTKAKGKASTATEVDIIADENNNALIITAPSSVSKSLQAIIKQLDIKRAQVLIEAIVANVSSNITNTLGTSLLFNNVSESSSQPIGGSIFPGLTNLLAAIGGDVPNPAAIPSGLNLLAGEEGRNSNFALLLNALDGDAATNILSTPSIVTLDNKEAEVIFGQNIPIITGSTASSSNANPFQTIDRQDVGITLKVKPQINDGNNIKLEISQEISSVSESTEAGLITDKRSIDTEVMIEDGQILVLGGLTEESYRESDQKVPLLGSIPILGRLFSSESNTKSTTNLMLFIRPIILHDREKADYFTNQKYKNVKTLQNQSKTISSGLFGINATPFPDIEFVLSETPEQEKLRLEKQAIADKKAKESNALEHEMVDETEEQQRW